MKKKILITTLAVATITVGVLAGLSIEQKEKKIIFTQADDAYTINAFEAYRESPGASVSVATTLGNEIVLSTDGVAVAGEKITIAPGGYIEVARDAGKEHLNALDGLKSITTDFEGRIAYSYRDQVVTYDDAVSGNFTFPEDHAPSFFKLYNNSVEAKEVNSLGITYNCFANESSFLAGKGTYSIADGTITSNGVQTTMTLLKQTKKGVLSYSASNNKTVATTFMGAAVGLSTEVANWYKGDATYTWAVLGAAGNATFVQRTTGSDDKPYFAGDTLANHLIKNYATSTFFDFTFKFDVDNNYYALYQGNNLMAVDTDPTSIGDKIGFICEYGGMSFKNIVLKTNIDFNKDVFQRRTKGQWDIYNDGVSNVYKGTAEDSWHYFKKELPSAGTITFDYNAASFASNWVEGLMFSDSTDIKAISSGKGIVFGTGKTNSYFNSIVFFDKGDGTFGTNWTGSRSGKFAYTLGTTLHLKLDYDLENLNWTLYKRDSAGDEWTSTGTFAPSAAQDISGLKYLGLRTASTHESEPVETTISNLVVNGVAW